MVRELHHSRPIGPDRVDGSGSNECDTRGVRRPIWLTSPNESSRSATLGAHCEQTRRLAVSLSRRVTRKRDRPSVWRPVRRRIPDVVRPRWCPRQRPRLRTTTRGVDQPRKGSTAGNVTHILVHGRAIRRPAKGAEHPRCIDPQDSAPSPVTGAPHSNLIGYPTAHDVRQQLPVRRPARAPWPVPTRSAPCSRKNRRRPPIGSG